MDFRRFEARRRFGEHKPTETAAAALKRTEARGLLRLSAQQENACYTPGVVAVPVAESEWRDLAGLPEGRAICTLTWAADSDLTRSTGTGYYVAPLLVAPYLLDRDFSDCEVEALVLWTRGVAPPWIPHSERSQYRSPAELELPELERWAASLAFARGEEAVDPELVRQLNSDKALLAELEARIATTEQTIADQESGAWHKEQARRAREAARAAAERRATAYVPAMRDRPEMIKARRLLKEGQLREALDQVRADDALVAKRIAAARAQFESTGKVDPSTLPTA
jgi:hypothetical protein